MDNQFGVPKKEMLLLMKLCMAGCVPTSKDLGVGGTWPGIHRKWGSRRLVIGQGICTQATQLLGKSLVPCHPACLWIPGQEGGTGF